MSLGGPDQQGSVPGLGFDEAAALARQHGMTQVGVRPKFLTYVGDLWRHRSFLVTLSFADFFSRHSQSFLGQSWLLLNPLLQGAAYFFIFGVLLDQRKDTNNFVAYLLLGLFTFIFISAAMNAGSKALTSNMGMVRALRFPRAVLPLSITFAEFMATLPAFAVLIPIVLITGERPSWAWLLYPVAILIVGLMSAGIAMLSARLVYVARDLANIIPLITRILRYVSGLFFVISETSDGWLEFVLSYQPMAVCLTMVRQCLMGEYPPSVAVWATSAVWAILFFVSGLIVIWRGEATYGRQ